ncbi:hypothetical protein LHP98_10915 [Rhodobacter sp. Har01]|uniref:DUF6958 family protein n=1 Tax=Rhodobacter sp. Har01 TaxID=2883999 RepID=UPI001D07BF30|nr:hypothetical protein [Rhodobacter sp. Har01]MCB6178639.1 hypothetical protein [Rhodobacter sp. Har01]
MSKTEILNVLQPGKSYRVDAAKFAEMRRAVLAALPAVAPGITPEALITAVKTALDPALFPGGEKAGWWVKAVQLDLEARGIVSRAEKPPVRLWKTSA